MNLAWVAPLLLFSAACSLGTPAAEQASPVETGNAEPNAADSMVPAASQSESPTPILTEALAIEVISGELTQGGWVRGKLPVGSVSAALDDIPLSFDKEGNFFAAFDRDAPDRMVLRASHEVGPALELPLGISPREWDIERVNVARRPGGGNDEEWWAKREPEWLAIRDARAKVTDAQGWRQEFVWPVKGRISGRFGRQRIYRGEPGSYHSGLDIAPGNGAPFVAPADGVVVLARTGFSLEGGIVIVDHGAGLNSAFIHLSRLAVAEGDHVEQGQLLGNVGASGRATGPHLHWSLMWRDKRLDPLLFLPPMP